MNSKNSIEAGSASGTGTLFEAMNSCVRLSAFLRVMRQSDLRHRTWIVMVFDSSPSARGSWRVKHIFMAMNVNNL